MKAREKSESSSWFGLPPWLALFLGVIVFAGVGFLLWLSAQAFDRSSTLDARRVRSLNIAADYIAKWPEVATTIGQTSLYHRGNHDPPKDNRAGDVFYNHLYHPEFGDFQVEYNRRTGPCETEVEIDNNRLTVSGEALKASGDLPVPEKDYLIRARKASWVPLDKDEQQICFTIARLDLKRVAPQLGSFSHLLLIKEPRKTEVQAEPGEQRAEGAQVDWREGRVVAWVGPSELPIRSLADLPALQSEMTNVLAATVQAYGVPKLAADSNSRNKDALEPFDSRVAGKDYRFYWRPIVLDLPGKASKAGNDSKAGNASNAEELESYILVGVAPGRGTPDPGRSRAQMLAFAFALFLLISLMPVVKLALLGPVDSMKAIEVAAICLGIVAAAALGTAFLTGVRDVLVARSEASDTVAKAATRFSGWIEGDLRDRLKTDEMGQVSVGLGEDGSNRLVVGKAPDDAAKQPAAIAKIENLFLLDANGRQAIGTVMKAGRDHVGANFNVSDRVYFRRAIENDFAPDTQQLAVATREKWPCTIWSNIEEGLVFDQVRSRTDGAPKTIIAAKLKQPAQGLPTCKSDADAQVGKDAVPKPSPAALTSDEERLKPSVVVAAFVMESMLEPRLDSGLRYAVLDVRAGASGRPVLFHSDSYRAGVEMFDESLDTHTLGRLSTEIGDPVDCSPKGDRATPANKFSGVYEEEPTLFAVARVPCTDWAVVAFKSRQLVDAQSVKPAVHAIVVWASLMILPYLLWILAASIWGDHAWVWLWPEPSIEKKDAYLKLTVVMALASVLVVLMIIAASPFKGFLFSVGAALVALGWLFWVHYPKEIATLRHYVRTKLTEATPKKDDRQSQQAEQAPVLRETPNSSDPPAAQQEEPEIEQKPSLDDATERRFMWFCAMLVIMLSVLPITALSADARSYFTLTSASNQEALTKATDQSWLKSLNAIARMEGMKTEAVNDRPRGEVKCDSCPYRFTERLRTAARYEDRTPSTAKEPEYWILGLSSIGLIDGFTLISLALLLIVILFLAILASTRGLFGFGVALEAVEYPKLELNNEGTGFKRELPPRFLVIRPNEAQLKILRQGATELDLYEEIRTKREKPLPDRLKGSKLVLIHNLGMVLGDPEARRKALQRIEGILVKQKAVGASGQDDKEPKFRVGILTSLTPLERLLQSFERERDEHEQLDEEQKTTARLERAKHREDMRWSAVFEEFTTFFHAARAREKPAGYECKPDAVKFIWKELEYVPDAAVAAMIGDQQPPVLKDEIIVWAEETTKKSSQPRAIVDFLASNLIEHYHLMWSLSSREERLLLYRIAYGHVPNVARAYALRSLVKRGLVVLDPYPRTMNKSFAQFVQHVEKQDTIRTWRQKQEHGSWDMARLPFALALPVAIVLLIVASVRTGDSFAAIIPLIVAAGPALINALTSARRTAAA